MNYFFFLKVDVRDHYQALDQQDQDLDQQDQDLDLDQVVRKITSIFYKYMYFCFYRDRIRAFFAFYCFK